MNEQPTHLDLFSGIGGFAVAAQWAGFRTVGFCEIDKYCQKVLAKNFLADAGREGQSAGRIRSRETAIGEIQHDRTASGGAVIHSDIFDLDGTQFRGVSLVTGGFPCQPFSVAGKHRGAADDRHLWPEMLRVITEARPAWVLGENVPGIIPMELDNVLSDLEGIGYACQAFVIPACAVDARHRRDRVWILAHAECGGGSWGTTESRDSQRTGSFGKTERPGGISNPIGKGLERQRQIACGTGTQFNNTGDHCRWEPEPGVGRVAHGIPSRVDRLKGLGNAIVPQVAYEILREIRKLT